MCYIVSVNNGDKEHIFILVIIIEIFFSDWVLGFMYLVLYGVIVGVIVLLPVYYGFSKFQEGLVIGVGFVIVLVLSFLCLLVVWMLMKFVNNETSKCEDKPENSRLR